MLYAFLSCTKVCCFWYFVITDGIVRAATTPIIANVIKVSANVNAKNFSAFRGGGKGFD